MIYLDNAATSHPKPAECLQRALARYLELGASPGLQSLARVRLFPADLRAARLPLVSCRVDGVSSQDVGAILDGDFDIAVRAGLHCAPLVHTDLGTLAAGTVRFSPGPFTTDAEIDRAILAMTRIAAGNSLAAGGGDEI